MTWPLVVEMIGHPRGKGAVRRDRLPNGYFVTHPDEKTAQYEGNLRLAAQKAMDGRPLFTCALRVLIEADFPIPTSFSGKKRREALLGMVAPTVKPDWDNLGKICDACNGMLWADDKQIVEGQVIKRYSDKPLLRISVWPHRASDLATLFADAAQ
ncbi:MAG: RusA family crossover junction endodeoxyribonuclease [Candidatus Binataceae bacterium]|nr:RusA family crossover junction endodeoxyribonuclease [Candidatus Binataceae bacterium]